MSSQNGEFPAIREKIQKIFVSYNNETGFCLDLGHNKKLSFDGRFKIVEERGRSLAGSSDRMHTVTYGDDDIEVIKISRFCRKIGIPDFSYRFPL